MAASLRQRGVAEKSAVEIARQRRGDAAGVLHDLARLDRQFVERTFGGEEWLILPKAPSRWCNWQSRDTSIRQSTTYGRHDCAG
jgi:hypothetical protein